MTTETRQKPTVEIRQHPRLAGMYLSIITTSRGLCYSCTWADGGNDYDGQPTEEIVLKAWKEDRKAFEPYRGY